MLTGFAYTCSCAVNETTATISIKNAKLFTQKLQVLSTTVKTTYITILSRNLTQFSLCSISELKKLVIVRCVTLAQVLYTVQCCTVHMMNTEQRQVAADLWTKPTDLSHKPACRQLIHYIHHRHLLLLSPNADIILSSHGGYRPAEST